MTIDNSRFGVRNQNTIVLGSHDRNAIIDLLQRFITFGKDVDTSPLAAAAHLKDAGYIPVADFLFNKRVVFIHLPSEISIGERVGYITSDGKAWQ